MKTNRSARRLVRVRLALVCLGVLALALLELGASHSFLARIGQNTAPQSTFASTPEIGIDDFMSAAGNLR